MVINPTLKKFKKDIFFKRDIIKTICWGVIGFTNTILLLWAIDAPSNRNIQIGLISLLIVSVIYYFHERLWQQYKWAMPSKRQQVQAIQKEIRPNLFKQAGRVSRQDREQLNNNKSFTLWLTGLSGAGKSSLATEIEEWIHNEQGHVYIIDGDSTRLGINSDLSFSDEDRTENIRRVAEICHLFNDAGIIVIASFISPFIADRLLAKKIIGAESFVEVYLEASVPVCQKRDKKGLYEKAIAGKIKNFTGISSPYEPPVNPHLHLTTNEMSIDSCVAVVKQYLIKQRFKDQMFIDS